MKLNILYSKLCAIRSGDFGNQFSGFSLYVMPIAHTLLSCLISEFFNSEHAKADKNGLKV